MLLVERVGNITFVLESMIVSKILETQFYIDRSAEQQINAFIHDSSERETN